jgi:hypothetical protein
MIFMGFPLDLIKMSLDVSCIFVRNLHRNIVNRTLRRHNDSVYYPLAIRAIAQQIDQLYWESAAPSSSVDGADNDEGAEIGTLDNLARDE